MIDEDEEDENEEKPTIKLTPDEDYDIGHYIRTDILNSAINWYTGESQQSQWFINIYIVFALSIL